MKAYGMRQLSNVLMGVVAIIATHQLITLDSPLVYHLVVLSALAVFFKYVGNLRKKS